MISDNGAAGPYVEFDGLPRLHAQEIALPRLHPYDDVAVGRYLTPGGGRMTIKTTTVHHQVTLDHLGCPAQTTEPKEDALKRLALATEDQCLRAGCTHPARFSIGNVFRGFDVRTDVIELSVFVRALLAIELGDFAPTDALTTRIERTRA